MRGARDNLGGAPHLVSALDQATGMVLAQVQVDAKSGELAAVPTLLAGLDLREVSSPPTRCTPSALTPSTCMTAAGTT